ncbi:hypothetical protein FQN60_010704 [Etheostoma spectabile]|uniref:ZP domain-containing protein n=1 Tax=Etheostoma spectabile TaxID=54343 RepID=A0A5J5CBV5_9PERO|nr:hypothetical protein FQN60_010684 [Etheostoma spectabile]KAA8579364.1 hypothetical protein FQN60_010704 [Etheostoma spectabile]
MEAGVVVLLLSALSGISSTLGFHGDSISLMPAKNNADGTFKVTFYHRQNGRSNCEDQSCFKCESGVCTGLEESRVLQTDQDNTGQHRWCQSERHTTATIRTNKTSFSLIDCSKANWTVQAELDLGRRSDSQSLNGCPITTTVSWLRSPQNCFSELPLLAYDPDGDHVRCRFAKKSPAPANFTMDETTCTLTSKGQVAIGVHVFELVLEDFSRKNLTLTYADGTSAFREASDTNSPPLCTVNLQFSLEILPPIPNCEAGHVRPVFLSRTPSHGDVLHATVGQPFQLYAQAQAHRTSIHDFQVSGPQNMSKVFKDDEFGKAEVSLSWTPQPSDLYRSVPVCFTAETNERHEVRCSHGKASVTCSPNKMTVALEKASMPGIDVNFLQLRDTSCSLTSNATHILGSMSFTTCGTKLEDKGDFLDFVNEITSFELANEIIVRRKTVKIEISCKFPKSISISSYYNLQDSDYIFTESSFGSFGYTFEVYTNSKFTSKVPSTAYPVEVSLLNKIYMGIQAQSDLPNVSLFVESCKATPDDNPKNTLTYDLIRNGCIKDETFKVHPSNQTAFNFEVTAFKFSGNYDEAGNAFSRCAQGCVAQPARRRKRSLHKETVSHSITQVNPPPASSDTKPSGGRRDSAPTVSSGGRWGIEQILNTDTSTVVFACVFFVALVLMVVLVIYFMRKRKADDQKSLLGWDN